MYIDRFYTWSKDAGGFYWKHREQILAGEYSDDTQLMICTLRALRYENWQEVLAFSEIPTWLLYQRGGGNSCKKQGGTLSRGVYPWKDSDIEKRTKYYASGGNGGVMRILPHLFVDYGSLDDLLVEVTKNGILTHGSPVAIIGTCYYATALYAVYSGYMEGFVRDKDEFMDLLLSGEVYDKIGSILTLPEFQDFVSGIPNITEYREIWEENMIKVYTDLSKISGWLHEGYVSDDDALAYLEATGDKAGSALACAMASIFLYTKYSDLMDGICIPANNTYTDTDSLAGMTGALFGLTMDLHQLPDFFKDVQDYDYILGSIDRLYESREVCDDVKVNTKKLKEQVFASKSRVSLGGVPSMTEVEVVGIRKLPCEMESKEVHQALVILDGGQKAYMKKFSMK